MRAPSQPVVAGLVTSAVGFSSTFALVLAGLRAVGASEDEAASGLLVLCVAMGVCAIVLSVRTRMPITMAWSTPGAALLLSSGAVDGGYAAAVGAFAVVGVLTVLAGLWSPLERLVAAVPVPLAAAMLAGVILPLCLAPVKAVAEIPELVASPLIVWAALLARARRWAVPAALVATVVVVAVARTPEIGSAGELLPSLTLQTPSLTLGALLGLALPLFVVTMASQNVPGMGVLAGFGYRPKLRPILLWTGGATVAGAPFGAHAVNLAAISAALSAGPEAGEDRSRRWVAAATAGGANIVLGLGAGLATILVAAAPALLISTVAGLALLWTLLGALQTAIGDDELREPALVCFVVSASAVTIAGISSAFWGLVAGLAFMALQRAASGRPRADPAPSSGPSSAASASTPAGAPEPRAPDATSARS